MIENLNDLVSFGTIVAVVVIFTYYIIRAIQFRRLTKHIREEQRYYKNWEE